MTKASRIYVESSAMVGVFSKILAGHVELLSSEVLDYEISKCPFANRRVFVRSILKHACHFQRVDAGLLKKAMEFARIGAKPLDAMHLAAASASKAEMFVTCDDRLLKRRWRDLRCVNPADLILGRT